MRCLKYVGITPYDMTSNMVNKNHGNTKSDVGTYQSDMNSSSLHAWSECPTRALKEKHEVV